MVVVHHELYKTTQLVQIAWQRSEEVVIGNEALELSELADLGRERLDLVPVQADVGEVHVKHVDSKEFHASRSDLERRLSRLLVHLVLLLGRSGPLSLGSGGLCCSLWLKPPLPLPTAKGILALYGRQALARHVQDLVDP